ncbi:MAG TPA: hypothetical protein VIT88_01080 [Pyrinomonadaceae bacterium]
MKKTLIVISLILSFVALSHGQQKTKPEARMVRPPFEGGDALHAIQEVALDLKAHAAGIGDRVAIRVCSKEKMPVALLAATASPFLLREHLEHHGLQSRLIFYLRSEDCLAQDPSTVVTEFWVAPYGADLPASVESIRSDYVQVQEVRSAGSIKTANAFNAALRDVIQRARNRTDVVAVVIGSYYAQPSAALKRNLETAKRVLERNDVQANRVFVHAAPFSGVPNGEKWEPTYPSLFVFGSGRDAASFETGELGIYAEFPGRSLEWLRIAEPQFARMGFKLDRYTITVVELEGEVTVILRSFDKPPDVRGSGGTYPAYEVDISKKTKKIVSAHYVR